MDNSYFRVLIVDDMSVNRLVLSSILATQGILSDQAESGKECIALCEEKDYDLILLDHRMPDMDGVDTLVELKKLFSERGRDVPVICHTTADGKENVNLYKAAGFADVLIKPIEPREFFDVIMMHLPAKKEEEEPVLKLPEDSRELSMSKEELEQELSKLPVSLKVVPHIDLIRGIVNCGGAEDYMDALYIFHSSCAEKSGEIEDFFTKEEWTMLGLKVHSLKSLARLVGAEELGEMAAALEKAAHEGNLSIIRRETAPFLKTYRAFAESLTPFAEEEQLEQMAEQVETAINHRPKEEPEADKSRSILFVRGNQGIVKKGIEQHLISAGFEVVSIADEPADIIAHRRDADIILYYPGDRDNSTIDITMNLLGEISQDDAKLLCLTGDTVDLRTALNANGAHRVSRTYPRPVDIRRFVKDMKKFSRLEREYHRRKTIFVVDDDKTYLSVIEHWLSPSYNVSCFYRWERLIEGLRAVTPNLILMDYEMPGMNGCQLMKKISACFPGTRIPVIFLTGKNDRQDVFKILENKPDGYLLKTSQKGTILDVINRYFSETMFRRSL